MSNEVLLKKLLDIAALTADKAFETTMRNNVESCRAFIHKYASFDI